MKKMEITLLAAFLVISLIVILYPLIANRLAEKNASLIETQYTERIAALSSLQREPPFPRRRLQAPPKSTTSF